MSVLFMGFHVVELDNVFASLRNVLSWYIVLAVCVVADCMFITRRLLVTCIVAF